MNAKQTQPDQSSRNESDVFRAGAQCAKDGDFQAAYEVFRVGAELLPNSALIQRWLGHRALNFGKLDEAESALSNALILAAGQPDFVELDVEGKPTLDTFLQNVHYHSGMVHFLRHTPESLEMSLPHWDIALALAQNDDGVVMAVNWQYATLMTLGRRAEAARALQPVERELEIKAYHQYADLCRAYGGQLDPNSLLTLEDRKPVDVASLGYGVGNIKYWNGDLAGAQESWRWTVEHGLNIAWGHLAARLALTRISK